MDNNKFQILGLLFLCFLSPEVHSHISEINALPLHQAESGGSVEIHPVESLSKVDDYQASESLSSLLSQSSVTSSGINQRYQWWNNADSPEAVESGWYGFNHFVPRSARNLQFGRNRKAKSSYLLGESTRSYPFTNFNSNPFHRQFDNTAALHQQLRELQRNLRPIPQREHFLHPQIIMIEQAMSLPPGILVPVVRPQRSNYRQRHSNFRPSKDAIRRVASAPTPVTIKVVPLKITSVDIANALKTMSWVPIPLEFLNVKTDDKGGDEGGNRNYNDKEHSEFNGFKDDEADLPPPSSHVATPLNKPLGSITYADSQRSQRYASQYQPRK